MLAQKHIHMQYRDNIENKIKKKIIYTVCVFIADFLKQINNKGLFELEKISLVPVNCVLTKCNHLFLIPAQHQGFLVSYSPGHESQVSQVSLHSLILTIFFEGLSE